MDYKIARELIKTGDLLAWYSEGFIGTAIRMFTGSDFSHVGVACWIKLGDAERLFVAESREGKGVQMVPLSQEESFDWIQGTGVRHTRKMQEYVLTHIGAKYDWASIFRRAGFGKMKNDNKFTCNEFASKCLIEGGAMKLVYDDPGQLMKAARSYEGRSQITVTFARNA